jgi:hypothetical protein
LSDTADRRPSASEALAEVPVANFIILSIFSNSKPVLSIDLVLTANTIANMHGMMGNKSKIQDFVLELKKPKHQSHDEVMEAIAIK